MPAATAQILAKRFGKGNETDDEDEEAEEAAHEKALESVINLTIFKEDVRLLCDQQAANTP